MTKLTPKIISKLIKNDKRIDQNVEYDEPGKALIWLNEGWTWEANDGNRSLEGFNLSNYKWEKPDDVSYFKMRLSQIEKVKDYF
jgi:hypothetical protein